MFDQFSETVLAILETVPLFWQLFILFLFSYSEGLPVIGSVLPGGTIALFAGSLSASGIIPPVTAVLIISGGSFLGDMTGFLIGKKFKHSKWIKKIVLHEKHQKSWDLFDRHIAIISIFGKIIPFVRSTPAFFAAARGIRTQRYVIYSLLGSILWGVVGVFAGNLFAQYFGTTRAIPFIMAILVLSILVVGVRYLLKRNKKIRTKGYSE